MTEIAEIFGYCTPDEVVAEVLNDIGDSANIGQTLRYTQWCIRGYGQLRQFALPVGKTVRLTIDSQTSTVTLPDDYVDFGDIGTNVKGEFWSFTEKPELIDTTTQDCGLDTLDEDKGEGETLSDVDTYKEYGLSGGRNQYYYKMDLNSHRIIVYASDLTEVILKYVSTGIKVDGSTLIPIIAKEALIAWLHWQRVLNDKNETLAEKQERKSIWASRLHELRKPRNLNSLYDTLYSTIKNTAKR